ncbi:P-loop containing nucleoside triphosphate hydrolase protein [Mycena olivaceomarginata]|nr:P-loop containing nucleoside triphosphate hydrolase protein [Mycena olivaceomarginata]
MAFRTRRRWMEKSHFSMRRSTTKKRMKKRKPRKTDYRAWKDAPAPRPVSKVPAQRAPDEFMCGVTAQPGRMVVHVPNMTTWQWKGAGLLHKSYTADFCFGPEATNEDVYEQTVKAYGLVKLAMEGAVDDAGNPQFDVHATFLELLGNKARDLMRGDEAGQNIQIREDETGTVRPELKSTLVKSAAELKELIVSCLGHRRTAKTTRNTKSGRSHAVLTILLKNQTPGCADGEIILVDLESSERHADSKKHSTARLQETRDNNKSLLALKDCIRACISGAVLVPFRASKLTLLLKVYTLLRLKVLAEHLRPFRPICDRKTSRPTRTVVIAHVSPHIQDAEHSANTLGYAAQFKAKIAERESEIIRGRVETRKTVIVSAGG